MTKQDERADDDRRAREIRWLGRPRPRREWPLAGPSRRPGAVPMTDHRWQGVPAISTCWDGATSAEACNIYAERFHDLREPRTTPAPGEPARAAARRA